MSMTLNVARLRIARELYDAEAALNDALIKQSCLFASLVTARRDTDSNPFVAHDALLRLARSQEALLAASGDMARAHKTLSNVQEEVTGYTECPPNEPTGKLSQNERLSEVA